MKLNDVIKLKGKPILCGNNRKLKSLMMNDYYLSLYPQEYLLVGSILGSLVFKKKRKHE